jgi:chorismate mutase
MPMRGIRGATAVTADQPQEILAATRELLLAIVEANPGLQPEEIASIFFTLTDDLSSVYPAQAARELGWTFTPLMCGREIPVPGSLPLCIRVLLHWNTNRPQNAIKHVYLREACRLRPDLAIQGLPAPEPCSSKEEDQ